MLAQLLILIVMFDGTIVISVLLNCLAITIILIKYRRCFLRIEIAIAIWIHRTRGLEVKY